ncbi:CPBP family intramembrane metalloprotease [Anaerocolumna sp. AGMB13025]|uniref:CPBP family intramembrane glutamic endopeptidase n=1 Tax=Anaerocolumna sp. AGMB13025 TaxID=3039116 RepID=UPI00241D968F|nr:CPBP family intramembrane glutamic endopeptidase [Anaerocolumna sp. AGMB13025]WFR56518.1 CPBP family intramembrane metalloprotease [Anaerocolumna sp. AGMB13025]
MVENIQNSKKNDKPFLFFIGSFLCFLVIYSLCSTLIEALYQGKSSEYMYLFKRIIQFALYMIYIRTLHSATQVGLNYPVNFKLHHLILSIAVMFSVIVFYENTIQLLIDKYLTISSSLMEEGSTMEAEMFRYPIPLILQTCITAPIAEELIIRGYLFKILKRKYTQTTALVICSLFFAILHFDFANTLFYFLIGLILGIVFIKLQSILYCILLHLLINLTAVTSYYAGYEIFEQGFNLYALLISAFVGIISIMILATISKKKIIEAIN